MGEKLHIVECHSDGSDSEAAHFATKFLVQLENGKRVEAVYMYAHNSGRRFFCLSTQVGCNMGCRFCATARQAWTYNLTAEEIAGQVSSALQHLRVEKPLHAVTLAGMGEPLANYQHSVAALELLRDRYALDVVSLSTVGITDRINQLTSEGRKFRLYFSLHATTDEKRASLIPIAKYHPLEDLLDAVSRYGERNGPDMCRTSYLLLQGVNDSQEDLARLVRMLRGRPTRVQILLWNGIEGISFKRVPDSVAEEWRDGLQSQGIDAFVQESLGIRIQAGCGQLATKVPPRHVIPENMQAPTQ